MLVEYQEAESEWDLDDIQYDDLALDSPTPFKIITRLLESASLKTINSSDQIDTGIMSGSDFEFDDEEEEPFKLTNALMATPRLYHGSTTAPLTTFHTPAQYTKFLFEDMPESPKSISSSRLYTPSLNSASSPVPSSNNSIIASESEDEGYDDLFGDFSIKERGLGSGKMAKFTYDEADEADDDDYCLGLDDDCDKLELPMKIGVSRDTLNDSACTLNSFESLVIEEKIEVIAPPPQKIRVTQKLAPATPTKCNYLRPTTASQAKQTLPKKTLMKTAKNAQAFGDGTELDSIDDLVVSKVNESKFVKRAKNAPIKDVVKAEDTAKRALLRPLGGVGRVRNLGDVSRFGSVIDVRRTPVSVPAKKEKAPKRKPTLIRSLNVPDKQTVGDMVFNPKLQTWEGNDDYMLDFDKIDTKSIRPSLITKAHVPESVGSMVFDPVKMCWIGNDDEDIFKDFEQDAPEPEKIKLNLEFILIKHLKESFCISESSHKLFMGSWYAKANSRNIIRDTSRAHLYDVRKV